LLRAQLRYQAGDPDGAVEDAALYLELGGNDGEMLSTAASICELGDDLENAEEALTRQIQTASDNTTKALAYAERGRIRYLQGRETAAQEDIGKAKRVNREVLTGVHYAISGLAGYNAGEYETSGKDFLQAARMAEEGNAEYYEQAIMCGYLSENYDFIKETTTEARSKNAMTASSLLIEGVLMFSEGLYEQAAASFTDAIDNGQIAVGTYYYRGLSRLALNQYETAAEDFTEALNWEEDRMGCLFNRAVCYFGMNKMQEAREDLLIVADNDTDEELAKSAKELLRAIPKK